MNNLNQTEFFILFLKKQQLKSDQLKNAYENFTKEVKKLNQPDFEYIVTYRELNLARIEFISLQSHFRYEQGKNALKNQYLQKAILLLEAEIELIKFQVCQLRSSFPETSQPQKSRIYFVPKSKGLGIDSMGELAVTLELSNQFINEEGNPASFIDISKALADTFNFTFGDVYKSKGRVFIRKPYNLTKALDFLKNLLIRESRDRKMKKDAFVSN